MLLLPDFIVADQTDIKLSYREYYANKVNVNIY